MSAGQTRWGKVAVVLAGLIVAGAWWLVPPPKPPRQVLAPDEMWVLPALPVPSAEKSLSALAVIAPWGKAAAVSGASGAAGQPEEVLNDPEWRFEGVTVNGSERLVLVRVAGQPVISLKEGDLLPGGAKILRIYDDSLSLLIKGKKRNLEIFQ